MKIWSKFGLNRSAHSKRIIPHRFSLSTRLACSFALVAFVLFALIGSGLYFVMRSELRGQLRNMLETRAEIARVIVARQTRPDHWAVAQERLAALTPKHGETLVYVSSEDPRFRFGEPIVGVREPARDQRYVLIRPKGMEDAYLTKTFDVPASGARAAVRIVVAVSRSGAQESMRILVLALAALIGLASVGMLFLSGTIVRFGLRPLIRLSKDAAELRPSVCPRTHAGIDRSDMQPRLQTDALPAELLPFASAFNGALERLDSAYERLDTFNADVAHELRTPVGIMIGQTEVALTQRGENAQLFQTLQSNREELERMRTIINDMLFISRAARGERADGAESVSLAAEVRRTLDFLEMPLEDAHIAVRLEGDAMAPVNRSLFGRALTNLLVNAIKHTAQTLVINVKIAKRQDGQIEIAVSNPGKPIAASEQQRLFDRFYRLDVSRANSHENHGLGLAIVQAVAEMHGGMGFMRSADGINTFGFSVISPSFASLSPLTSPSPLPSTSPPPSAPPSRQGHADVLIPAREYP